MAPPWVTGGCRRRLSSLRAACAGGRGREVRSRVSRGRRRHARRRRRVPEPHRAQLRRAVRTADAAGRARGRHRTHRPRRYRVDELQRAVPHRAQVRVARSHQRRPRRMEPRHVVERARSAQLQPRRAFRSWRTLCTRGGVCRRRARAVGQLGRRRVRARSRKRPLLRSRQTPGARSSRPLLPGARAAERRARRRGIRLSCRPVRRRPARGWPRVRPR